MVAAVVAAVGLMAVVGIMAVDIAAVADIAAVGIMVVGTGTTTAMAGGTGMVGSGLISLFLLWLSERLSIPYFKC